MCIRDRLRTCGRDRRRHRSDVAVDAGDLRPRSVGIPALQWDHRRTGPTIVRSDRIQRTVTVVGRQRPCSDVAECLCGAATRRDAPDLRTRVDVPLVMPFRHEGDLFAVRRPGDLGLVEISRRETDGVLLGVRIDGPDAVSYTHLTLPT